jgi:hypothetical protein
MDGNQNKISYDVISSLVLETSFFSTFRGLFRLEIKLARNKHKKIFATDCFKHLCIVFLFLSERRELVLMFIILITRCLFQIRHITTKLQSQAGTNPTQLWPRQQVLPNHNIRACENHNGETSAYDRVIGTRALNKFVGPLKNMDLHLGIV